jgi:hypothetical protein
VCSVKNFKTRIITDKKINFKTIQFKKSSNVGRYLNFLISYILFHFEQCCQLLLRQYLVFNAQGKFLLLRVNLYLIPSTLFKVS